MMSEDQFSDQEEEDFNTSGVWGESDCSFNNSLNESFVSVSSQPSNKGTPSKRSDAPSSCEGTPTKKGKRTRKEIKSSEFKKPSAPKKNFAQCHICKNKLRTESGFDTHMMTHRLRDLANKFGGKENVIQHLRKNIHSVLQKIHCKTDNKDLQGLISEMLKERENVALRKDFDHFIEGVLNIIDKCFEQRGNSSIMPEALRSHLQISLNKCMSNKELVEDLRRSISAITPC